MNSRQGARRMFWLVGICGSAAIVLAVISLALTVSGCSGYMRPLTGGSVTASKVVTETYADGELVAVVTETGASASQPQNPESGAGVEVNGSSAELRGGAEVPDLGAIASRLSLTSAGIWVMVMSVIYMAGIGWLRRFPIPFISTLPWTVGLAGLGVGVFLLVFPSIPWPVWVGAGALAGLVWWNGQKANRLARANGGDR